MRVLILANYDVGLYQFRRELIAELLKNHTVILSLPYGELVEPLKEMGCIFVDTPVDRRGIDPMKDIVLFKQYYKIIKKYKPDLVLTYTIKPNVYGGFVCRLLKVPYVANITGLGTAFQKKGLLRSLVTVMYKTGLKKAKVVFFENVENQRIFLKEKIVKKEQTWLLNGAGVNLEHYPYAEYPMDQEETRFLFIGRVMKEKGIDELLSAMQRLQEAGIKCTLDVVGGYEEDYKETIESLEEKGWLRYHGYQKDVRPFIVTSHCFVLPSWHEGMANTNLECAAMGRPVITTDIHGCKEAVIDGVSGYLCKKQDEKSLYKKMRMLAWLTPQERADMGKAGREYMKQVFDKSQVVKETIKRIE